ncbi:hypothetical protein Tco_1262945 [Tanacetum coccineum]
MSSSMYTFKKVRSFFIINPVEVSRNHLLQDELYTTCTIPIHVSLFFKKAPASQGLTTRRKSTRTHTILSIMDMYFPHSYASFHFIDSESIIAGFDRLEIGVVLSSSEFLQDLPPPPTDFLTYETLLEEFSIFFANNNFVFRWEFEIALSLSRASHPKTFKGIDKFGIFIQQFHIGVPYFILSLETDWECVLQTRELNPIRIMAELLDFFIVRTYLVRPFKVLNQHYDLVGAHNQDIPVPLKFFILNDNGPNWFSSSSLQVESLVRSKPPLKLVLKQDLSS